MNRNILFRMVREERQISPLTFAILGLIYQQPRSGYDVGKIFSTTPMGRFSSSPGPSTRPWLESKN